MRKLRPDKLSVDFLFGSSPTKPLIPRRYTLTHSDLSGKLFLTVGRVYNRHQLNEWQVRRNRHEVLAEWEQEKNGSYTLQVYVLVSGPGFVKASDRRNRSFRKELPLALQAIRYGDQRLFISYPDLNLARVIVNFQALEPEYSKVEQWGTVGDYRLQ